MLDPVPARTSLAPRPTVMMAVAFVLLLFSAAPAPFAEAQESRLLRQPTVSATHVAFAHGGPSELLPAPFGHRGWYSPDGRRMVVDAVSRWDVEWRGYRGGQNTPLVLLDLETLEETLLPNERTMDIHPVWMGDRVYFLSDRDWISNV